ncbi:MAG: S1C family serine protease [Planctomycetota bacterium]|jgi:S1-C subfamily serine protease
MPRQRPLLLGVLLATLTTLPACAQTSIEDLFDRVAPSVVTLKVTSTTISSDDVRREVNVGGLGSGVLVSSDGDIMTAAHVVQVADEIAVIFADGTEMEARVVASEPPADVALVRLTEPPPAWAVVAPIGDSDAARVGSRVIVIGAPQGLSHSLTVGHLSARRRLQELVQGFRAVEILQTDAGINQGNSGGPLFNLDGEVIGIVSYIVSESGGSEGLGFAIASNLARELLLERRSFWSGTQGVIVAGDVAKALNTPFGQSGILVQQVAKGSPADELGLRGGTIRVTLQGKEVLLGGDIILEVDSIPAGLASSYNSIRERMTKLQVGDEITVKIVREGQVEELVYTMPEDR